MPGLGLADFRRICENGFGDAHNSFAHSMAWYKGHLYIGTTRSNFQMIKSGAMPFGAAKLPDVEIQTITNWIEAGTPDN